MLYRVEIREVGKALIVGLKDRCCLNPLDTILNEIWSHLVEYHRRKTLILIVRTHSNKKQVEVGHLLRLQSLYKMIPPKREEVTTALASGVEQIPCFILIDSNGTIIGRWSHLTADATKEIEQLIN